MSKDIKTEFTLGHRTRLIEKLYNNYKITSVELIEILLFAVIKRRDTKPMAKMLLSKFKSVMGICEASPQELRSINGLGEKSVQLIKTFYYLLQNVRHDNISNRDVIENFDQLVQYCQFKLAHKAYEELHVIFLNSRKQIIHIEENSNGETSHIDINPKKIVHQGLNYGASSIIITHNHPSGNPTPSSEDIQATLYLKQLLQGLNIALEDHLIIAHSSFFSFKKQKLI